MLIEGWAARADLVAGGSAAGHCVVTQLVNALQPHNLAEHADTSYGHLHCEQSLALLAEDEVKQLVYVRNRRLLHKGNAYTTHVTVSLAQQQSLVSQRVG